MSVRVKLGKAEEALREAACLYDQAAAAALVTYWEGDLSKRSKDDIVNLATRLLRQIDRSKNIRRRMHLGD